MSTPAQEPTIPEMFNLSGKVALVTGAAGWLVQSFCRGLAEAGASVVCAEIPKVREKAQEVARSLPVVGGAGHIEVEVTPVSQVVAGVDRLLERGYIDSKKLGVTGGSGGGVLTNWTVTHTDEITHAVDTRERYDVVIVDVPQPTTSQLNRLYTREAPEFAVGWIPTGTAEGSEAWLRYVGRLAEHFRRLKSRA